MQGIRFTRPTLTGDLPAIAKEIQDAVKLSGDGVFGQRVTEVLSKLVGHDRVLLTGSCTQALELSFLLLNLRPGDEVIMPSFTFSSTANAVVLRRGVPVFVDVEPDTMNVDPDAVEAAITDRTRAIAVVHYAGVACDMDQLLDIASRNGLSLVEDAAQAVDAYYRDRHLGSLGSLGTFSFHDTKNVTSGGEGGALIVNDQRLWDRARVLREKGTNRAEFFEGLVDKYTWVDVGTSALMSESAAALLLPQLENLKEITSHRLHLWHRYEEGVRQLVSAGLIDTGTVPQDATFNGHIFYLRTRTEDERSSLILHMKNRGIATPFHYVPLHSAPAGVRFGRFAGRDQFTTSCANRLVRLPLYHQMSTSDVDCVLQCLYEYYEQ